MKTQETTELPSGSRPLGAVVQERTVTAKTTPGESVTALTGDVAIPLMTLANLEKLYILQALKQCGGNKPKTAAALGVSVKTIYNKLHQYGVNSETL